MPCVHALCAFALQFGEVLACWVALHCLALWPALGYVTLNGSSQPRCADPYLLTYLRAYLLAYLPTYLRAYLPARASQAAAPVAPEQTC